MPATCCPRSRRAARGWTGAGSLWGCAGGQVADYLSATGVYGGTGGAWVDETAPLLDLAARAAAPPAPRPTRSGWRSAHGNSGCRGSIGRPLRARPGARGQARRIDLPGQVFSRCMSRISYRRRRRPRRPGAAGRLQPSRRPAVQPERGDRGSLRPARPAAAALRKLENAGLRHGRAFYAESRRVANGKAKRCSAGVRATGISAMDCANRRSVRMVNGSSHESSNHLQ